jgi:hypothetical protein
VIRGDISSHELLSQAGFATEEMAGFVDGSANGGG